MPDLRRLGPLEIIGEEKLLLFRNRLGRNGRPLGGESSGGEQKRKDNQTAQ